MQTPPSWPVIQSFGRSLGQLASTANLGAVWALAGDKAERERQRRRRCRQSNEASHGVAPTWNIYYSNFLPPR